MSRCGGAPFGPQLGSLEHGAHVIVGTPRRVEEHLRKCSQSLAELNTLVLDEATACSICFQAALEAIIGETPPARQPCYSVPPMPRASARSPSD